MLADNQLRDIAYKLLTGTDNADDTDHIGDENRWLEENGDVFVTGYKKPCNTKSENVWCCYSNGDRKGENTVVENLFGASETCRTIDPRRTNQLPAEVELTILAPEARWEKIDDISNLSQKRGRALYVLTTSGSAFYIPSVWNERPDWTPKQIINSLANKAGGGDILTVYEVPVYEIPSYSTEAKHANFIRDRGFFSDNPVSILGKAWDFYYGWSKCDADDFQLAYEVAGLPIYDNDGAWVRTYGDLETFYRLSKYLGIDDTSLFDNLYVDSRSDEDDYQTKAARINLLLTLNRPGDKSEVNKLVNQIHPIKPGVYDSDLSFANPQIIIALIRATNTQEAIGIANDYVNNVPKQIPIALGSHGAFAGNWIAQALAVCAAIDPTLRSKCKTLLNKTTAIYKELSRAALNGDSVTERACAITGLEAIKSVLGTSELDDLISESLAGLVQYQTDDGGFPYNFDGSLVRTDVTSHVVEAFMMHKK